MDLVELRLLAAGGMLAVGLVLSVLGALAAAAVERIGWLSHARAGRASGPPVVHRRPDLDAGRAQC